MIRVPLDRIRIDGGTQPRAMISYAVVEEYCESLQAGASFPPVVIFYDGEEYWLADGFHRHKAARSAGLTDIGADVRQGTRDDAVWFSCGANKAHGLRRTNDDKNRAVASALKLVAAGYKAPDLKGTSDRAFADFCGVGHELVAKVRAELQLVDSTSSRTGLDGKTRTTTPANQSKGGKASAAARKASAPDPEPAPAAPRDFLREAMTQPEPAPTPAPPAQERQPFGLEYRTGLAGMREIMAGFLPIERRAAVAAITEDQRVKDIA